jgi:hypothetical protein
VPAVSPWYGTQELCAWLSLLSLLYDVRPASGSLDNTPLDWLK